MLHKVITPLHSVMFYDNNHCIHIKRDDLLPTFFGGNKYRIAEAFFEDMKKQGCNHMVGYGPTTSNLSRVLSGLARRYDVPCTIVCADENEVQSPCFNANFVQSFGANVVPCSKAEVAQTVQRVLDELKSKGEKPYYIYGNAKGEGNEAVATSAYVPIYDEMLQQHKMNGFYYSSLYLPVGTGMTMGGLLAGQVLSKETPFKHPEIIGVSVAREASVAKASVLKYANAIAPVKDATIIKPFNLSYGESNTYIDHLIDDMFKEYGIPLDRYYTGKAFYAMLKDLETKPFQNVLFLHTGGTPLFFDHMMNFFNTTKELI